MAWHWSRAIAGTMSMLAFAAGVGIEVSSAQAISIELKDAASDRIDRQRAAAEGRLPLPDTPDTERMSDRLAAKGLKLGSAVVIRIFKAQSELEIWIEKDGSYEHFATYPICHWSGTLGPKLRQGDKQSPEGFYTVTSQQVNRSGRWPLSLNLGYPNPFDRALARNGSHILVHGGCSSVGCYAMTNPVINEIYVLTSAALRGGQRHIPVYALPFRMTPENFERYPSKDWAPFWQNLKEGNDIFERTRRPPKVNVCAERYHFVETSSAEAKEPGPLGVCSQTTAQIEEIQRFEDLVPPHVLESLLAGARSGLSISASLAAPSLQAIALGASVPHAAVANFHTPRQPGAPGARRLAGLRSYSCSPGLASCRKFMSLQARAGTRRSYVATAGAGKKRLTVR
jgi:murein L,D-transpeptidase YafK